MEDNKKLDLIDFDASPYLIALNSKRFIGGRLFVKMRRNDAAPDPLSSKPYIAVDIEGTLITSFYEQNIASIETRRFFIDEVDVYEESFQSINDDITYKFKAGSVRVKYQQEDSPEQLEKRFEQNGK